ITENLATLRVQTAHDVFDHAVFAGRVHALQHHEESILVGGPQKLLGISHTLQISLDDFLGLPFQLVTYQLPHLLGARPGGIPTAQSHFVPRLDSKKMTELLMCHYSPVPRTSECYSSFPDHISGREVVPLNGAGATPFCL